MILRRFAVFVYFGLTACAQEPVTITIDAAKTIGPYRPIWAYFGYDEPNYTYAPNGTKLISELAALSPVPVFIRAHNLLTTGDGVPALKWGSTNAYTEDATGLPIYNWTIVDRIFDTYLQNKAKPFVEIGFMPEALSTHPAPYRPEWPKSLYLGWTYPPKSYAKWGELVKQWAQHAVSRYGQKEVESWYWEVWNEPDIAYWHGTPEEYNELYDVAVKAVKTVLPNARVGGPATTSPSGTKAAAFLRQFLEHVAATGVPLDFISYHAKGAPQSVEGQVRMGIAKQLADVDEGMRIVTSFPQLRSLPIILSEADPEGCAACSARTNPQNAYRNGALYPCYTAAAMGHMLQLADRDHANLEGMLTWAFEFEGRAYFEGFRTLATNGVDKPVLNFFRMAGKMNGERIQLTSDGAVGLDSILAGGVRGRPDIDGFATSGAALIWNYHDDDLPGPDAPITVHWRGLKTKSVELRHYRIDATHSNAYTVWKAMGSPQEPTSAQYQTLERAGKLEMLEPPKRVTVRKGKLDIQINLPRQAVSLLELKR